MYGLSRKKALPNRINLYFLDMKCGDLITFHDNLVITILKTCLVHKDASFPCVVACLHVSRRLEYRDYYHFPLKK